MKREDDFEVRRAHLKGLTDQELYDRFWALCEQLVDPLLDMGRVSSVRVRNTATGILKRRKTAWGRERGV